jgi:2,3,4,5-tetrahydropyridine-2-carboxylate N-succinyltransferase
MESLRTIVEEGFLLISSLNPSNAPLQLKQSVLQTIEALEQGRCRVAEKINGEWIVQQWLKQAILLYFRLFPNQVISNGISQFYDKVPLRFTDLSPSEFEALGIRVVPPAYVRKGAYIAANCILMPSYINIGAYIDSGSMIDIWATVASAAQIGKNVHISAGVCIGGVLEPLQAHPTIIEDHCFIGANSSIVEGVIVETGAVISMGVHIGQSTRIYDREQDCIYYGRVPAGAVVVSGSLPSKIGHCHISCAVIVKRVDSLTRQKVSINEILREAI